MFSAINRQFNESKRKIRDDQLIMESVLEVEEVLPGSDEDIDDVLDSDSISKEVYDKVDAMLDKLVSASDYDDVEAEELLDDGDDDDITDEELDAIITEAVDGDLEALDEGIRDRIKQAKQAREVNKAANKDEGVKDTINDLVDKSDNVVKFDDLESGKYDNQSSKNESALDIFTRIANI